MGKCFSAMKGGGGKGRAGKPARPTNSNHMGPEGVENSIFLGKDEPLFPRRDPLKDSAAGLGSPPPPNDSTSAEVAPLSELVPNGENGSAPPQKQAVMRRSFPPVGVSLLMDEPMQDVLSDPQRLAQIEGEMAQAIAEIFSTSKERLRIMQFKPSEPPGSVTIQMNIVADRSDTDMRSPMQLAAELVTQSQNDKSQLRQAPVFRGLRSGSIAEDPFPGTKQDSWAGGVATLRPAGVEGTGGEGKKKKKKSTAGAGATGASVNASNAHTQATPTTTATPRSEQVPASPNERATPPAPMQQAPPTAQEMAVINTSELPGGTISKDAGQYAGELIKGQRHGRGKQHYPNGDVFTGCFQNDKRFGIGRLDLANNGGFYLGEWKDDDRSGKGSLTYGNKDMYVGTWAKSMREGEGKLLWATGAWYQGQFKKDEMHGKGTLQKENQDKYEGEFFEGKFHGKGVYTPAAGGAPRTGYWCMGDEIVDKSDEEAQLIVREGVSKSLKQQSFKAPPPGGPKGSATDELAAKLQHRNARNDALSRNDSVANQQTQHQQPPAPAPPAATSAPKNLPVPPSQPEPPENKPPPPSSTIPDLQVGNSNMTSPVKGGGGGEGGGGGGGGMQDPLWVRHTTPPATPPDDSMGASDAASSSAQRPPLAADDGAKDRDAAKASTGERRGMPAPPTSSMTAASLSKSSSNASKKPSSASISEAKPPTRPQRSGANMSTSDTLKMVSDKLGTWQSSGATLNYGD